MPTPLELAILADLSYEASVEKIQRSMPIGWGLYEIVHSELLVGDFHAKLFINLAQNIIVFAFRGTDFTDLESIADVIKIIFKDVPRTYTHYGRQFIEKNIEHILQDRPYASIMMTGHSKGAFYATFAALQYNYPAVVFNSPGAEAYLSELNIHSYNASLITHIISEPHCVTWHRKQVVEQPQRIGLPFDVAQQVSQQEVDGVKSIVINTVKALNLVHAQKTIIKQLIAKQNNPFPVPTVAGLDLTQPISIQTLAAAVGLGNGNIPHEWLVLGENIISQLWGIDIPLSDVNPLSYMLSKYIHLGNSFLEAALLSGGDGLSNPFKKMGNYMKETAKAWSRESLKKISNTTAPALANLSFASAVIGATVLMTAVIYGMIRWADRRNEVRYRDLKNDIRNLSLQLSAVHADLVQRLDQVMHMQIEMMNVMMRGFQHLERVFTKELDDFKVVTLAHLQDITQDMWTMFAITENNRLQQNLAPFREVLNQIDSYIDGLDGNIMRTAEMQQALLYRDMVKLHGWITQEASMQEYNGGIYLDRKCHWNKQILEVFYQRREFNLYNLAGFFAKFSYNILGAKQFPQNFQLDWIFHPIIWLEGVHQYLRARPYTKGYDLTYKGVTTLIEHGMNFRQWIHAIYSVELFRKLFDEYLKALTSLQQQLSQNVQNIAIERVAREHTVSTPKLSLGSSFPKFATPTDQRALDECFFDYQKSIASIHKRNQTRLTGEMSYIYQYISGLMSEEDIGKYIRLPINTIAEFTSDNNSYCHKAIRGCGGMAFHLSHNIPMGAFTESLLSSVELPLIFLIAERLGLGKIYITYELMDLQEGNGNYHSIVLKFNIHYRDFATNSTKPIATTGNISSVISFDHERRNLVKNIFDLWYHSRCGYQYSHGDPVLWDVATVEYALELVVVSLGESTLPSFQWNMSNTDGLQGNVRTSVKEAINELQKNTSKNMVFLASPTDANAEEMRKTFESVDMYYYFIVGYMKFLGFDDAKDDEDTHKLRQKMWDFEVFRRYYQDNRNLNFLPEAKAAMNALKENIEKKLNSGKVFINSLLHEINCCLVSLYGIKNEIAPPALLTDLELFSKACSRVSPDIANARNNERDKGKESVRESVSSTQDRRFFGGGQGSSHANKYSGGSYPPPESKF